MVQINPFKAIRPKAELAAKIASLPYDVLTSTEAAELAKYNSYSFLHIDKAEIDLPPETAPDDDRVYQKAADHLNRFLENRWLIQDHQESLYLYELTCENNSQLGLAACTTIEDMLDGKVKKHEYTREEKERDRMRHIDATDAQTSPIFLTYRKNEHIDSLMKDWAETHSPIYDFTSFYKVTHRMWVIDDLDVMQEIIAAFQTIDHLYIADGHHRAASAVNIALSRKQAFPNLSKEAESQKILSVMFPQTELAILDYNRVLKVDIPSDFFEQLAPTFSIEPVDKAFKPNQKGMLGLYLKGHWYALKVKSEKRATDPIAGLDVSIVQEEVLKPIFAIRDVRKDPRIDFVGGIEGLKGLTDKVDSGEYTIAFAMYPPTMEELLAAADSGKMMPPKSTWFEPKLLSGLLIHDLETPEQ